MEHVVSSLLVRAINVFFSARNTSTAFACGVVWQRLGLHDAPMVSTLVQFFHCLDHPFCDDGFQCTKRQQRTPKRTSQNLKKAQLAPTSTLDVCALRSGETEDRAATLAPTTLAPWRRV
jgi:hypothetical protein